MVYVGVYGWGALSLLFDKPTRERAGALPQHVLMAKWIIHRAAFKRILSRCSSISRFLPHICAHALQLDPRLFRHAPAPSTPLSSMEAGER